MKNSAWWWLLIVVTLFLSKANAAGSAAEPDPVKASLVVSVDSVTPGQPFMAGVYLKIDPRWHVYWKSSGDAGLPTRVIWKLPDGWTAGPLQWPLPERFVEKGPIATYGYRDSVMLTAEITPPEQAKGHVSLTAQVDWMVCSETCIPGNATVILPIVVTNSLTDNHSPSKDAKWIAAWTGRLPGKSSINWQVRAAARSDTNQNNAILVDMIITGGGKILDWYPVASKSRAVRAVSVKKSPGKVELSFTLKSFDGPIASGEQFESLLIYNDGSPNRRGTTISVTLNPT